ncbi:MAG: lipase maturation factor family protein [Myxococcales bacterium]|nr:lipase maturation factor family protein [Myxococcales bacterium]
MTSANPASRLWLRAIYVRAIAFVHLIAVGSLWWQIHALVGTDGILPLDHLFASARQLGPDAWTRLPTVLWLMPADGGLNLVCLASCAMALALIFGARREGPLLLGLAGAYLSLSTVGQVFLQYQWDTLLVEATVAASFVARWRRGPPTEPPRWAWWLQHWLVFRLMFFAGWAKIQSGDPAWTSLTALDYHFWTQPLPNPWSRAAHDLPGALHSLGVLFTLVVELHVPWLILVGRRGRLVAFLSFTALMIGLAVTGNYGFFQLLSVVVALSLLDDQHLFGPWRSPAAPAAVPETNWDPDDDEDWDEDAEEEDWSAQDIVWDDEVEWDDADESVEAPPSARPGSHLGLPVALGLVFLSLLQIRGYPDLPDWGKRVLEVTFPWRVVNSYGLFAVMTKDRPEIVLEGSSDGGETWWEMHLRYKPGPLNQQPPQVAPHMPRVDWQLWFAALGSCQNNRWVLSLMQELIEGNPLMDDLFLPGTFERGYPEQVRAMRYRYSFDDRGSGAVWTRTLVGPYCPTLATPGRRGRGPSERNNPAAGATAHAHDDMLAIPRGDSEARPR